MRNISEFSICRSRPDKQSSTANDTDNKKTLARSRDTWLLYMNVHICIHPSSIIITSSVTYIVCMLYAITARVHRAAHSHYSMLLALKINSCAIVTLRSFGRNVLRMRKPSARARIVFFILLLYVFTT